MSAAPKRPASPAAAGAAAKAPRPARPAPPGGAAGYVSLPKVELHAHFGGAARRATVEEMLRARGHPDPAGRAAAMSIPTGPDGVPEVRTPFDGFEAVWEAHRDERPLVQRIVREYIADCVADGVVYAELRTGGGSREKLEWVLDALGEGAAAGCEARLIVSIKRDGTEEEAWTAVRNAVALRARGVVGVDFCGGIIIDFPFTAGFHAAVAHAQREGLRFVPHFAEFKGEKDNGRLLDAGPARLGHALHMAPEIERRVLDSAVPIECCLAGNLNDLRRDGLLPRTDECCVAGLPALRHPMVGWWQRGHPFALCCDNPGMFRVPLSTNYRLAAEALAESTGHPAETVAWRLAERAVGCILAGDDVQQRLRHRLAAHPWAPPPGE